MFEKFFPDEYLGSTYKIPFEKLYEQGYRGVIFDIDNTLVPHGAPADERAKRLFQRLREIGFESCLLSNNQKKSVEMVNQEQIRRTRCLSVISFLQTYGAQRGSEYTTF